MEYYGTRTQAEAPEGYYTSKYSGEEIDALLDKIAPLEAAVAVLTGAAGGASQQGAGA